MQNQAAIFTTLLPQDAVDKNAGAGLSLSLTADMRRHSRYRLELSSGKIVQWHLPRGTVLHHDDRIAAADGSLARVVAAPEPVLQVTAPTPLLLLRAAYHLGNRHVPLEITADYLRLSADPILKQLLEQLGLQVVDAIAPFQPEAGAYSHAST